MTDAELLEQFRGGSQQAFAELVRRHVDWVHGVARRRMGDAHLADDVTQMTFVVLARKAPRLTSHGTLSPWLFPVANFVARQVLRTEYRRRLRETEAAKMRQTQTFDGPGTSAEWTETAGVLDEVVGRLRSRDRQAVLMRFYERKSFPEIGQAMRITEEAARKRVSRAVEQLRGLLARRGVTVGTGTLGAMMTANLADKASAAVVSASSAATGASTAAATLPIVKAAGAMLTWMSIKPIALVAAALMFAATTTIVVRLASAPSVSAVAATSTPATAPTAAAAAAGYRGRVVDSQDRAVAGATIWLVRPDDDGEPQTLDTTASGGDGVFAFAEPFREGTHTYAMIRAAGYGITAGRVAEASDDEELLDVRLPAPTRLRVRFVGPDGKPAAGVRVGPIILGGRAMMSADLLPNDLKEQLAQTSDAAGVCTFDSMPADGRVRLDVIDNRFAHLVSESELALEDAETTDGGTIRLAAGASLSGRVVFADSGKPAPGVRVMAQSTNASPASGWGSNVTDVRGEFFIPRLAAAEYNIMADVKGDLAQRYTAAALERVRVLAGENATDNKLSLIGGGFVRGRLIEKGTDRPLSGIPVGLHGPARPRSSGAIQSANSAADGSYELRVPPGKQYVYIATTTPPGLRDPVSKSHDVEVADGQTATADFVFPRDPSPPLKGRVIDADGKPVRNAVVGIEHARSEVMFGANAVVRTDADGNFTVVSVPNKSLVRARKGRRSTAAPVTVSAANRDNITLTLRPDALLTVIARVQDPDGKPLAGAKVGLFQWNGQFGIGIDSRTTGSDGTCMFKDLPADGRYNLDASARGYGIGQTNVKVEADARRAEPPPIVLPRATSFIAGIVLDVNNEPVPDVEVMFSSSRSRLARTRTDALGHFRVENVVDDDKVLVWTREGPKSSKTQEVPAGTDNAVIIHRPVDDR